MKNIATLARNATGKEFSRMVHSLYQQGIAQPGKKCTHSVTLTRARTHTHKHNDIVRVVNLALHYSILSLYNYYQSWWTMDIDVFAIIIIITLREKLFFLLL